MPRALGLACARPGPQPPCTRAARTHPPPGKAPGHRARTAADTRPHAAGHKADKFNSGWALWHDRGNGPECLSVPYFIDSDDQFYQKFYDISRVVRYTNPQPTSYALLSFLRDIPEEFLLISFKKPYKCRRLYASMRVVLLLLGLGPHTPSTVHSTVKTGNATEEIIKERKKKAEEHFRNRQALLQAIDTKLNTSTVLNYRKLEDVPEGAKYICIYVYIH